MTSNLVVKFFETLDVSSCVHLEILEIDVVHECAIIRTKYLDQFDYIKRIFLKDERTDIEIDEFNSLRVFYMISFTDLNLVLSNKKVEVFSDSKFHVPVNIFVESGKTVYADMLDSERNVTSVVTMTDQVFEKLKEHVEKKNSEKTEVYSICKHKLGTHESEHKTIVPVEYKCFVKRAHSITDFYVSAFRDYKKTKHDDFISEWKSYAISVIASRVKDRKKFGFVDVPLPYDTKKDEKDLHPVLSMRVQSNIEKITIRVDSSHEVVFSKEKTFNRSKFNFDSESHRFKCVGGSRKVKTGIEIESPLETFIREMSEEWSFDQTKLQDMFTLGKIKLYDKLGRIVKFDTYVPYRNGKRHITLAPFEDLEFQVSKMSRDKSEKENLLKLIGEYEDINMLHFRDIIYIHSVLGDDIFDFTFNKTVDYDNCLPLSNDNGLFVCKFDVTCDELKTLFDD